MDKKKELKGHTGRNIPLKQQLDIQSMIWIGIIFLFIFSYLPMYGIIMAFQEYKIGEIPGASEWVGLKHFREMLKDPMIPNVVRNTIVISLLKLLINFPAPIILALLLNEIAHEQSKRYIQTISYLPHFISWVVAAGLIMDQLRIDGGAFNEILVALNIIEKPINFMGEPDYFWPILIITDLWKEIGWGSIIYMAAIAGIDQELYEAAAIDGANRFQRVWHITLSGLKPTIIILLLLTIGNLFNTNFDQIMMLTNRMTNPRLMPVAQVVDTYVYRTGMTQFRYSYATAVGLVKNIINVILLIAANKISGKLGQEQVI